MGARRPMARTRAPQTDPEGALAPADRSGFTRFFEREWPRLRRHLSGLVGAQEAEEVAQEAFVRLYPVSGGVRSMSGFLYKTAHNLVIDNRRGAKRAHAVLVEGVTMDAIADPTPSPEDRAYVRRRLDGVSAMLERMSPKCRRVFLLRVVEECTYKEIAARLNISVVAVEKQLLRAFEICAEWNEGASGVRRKRTRIF